MSRQPISDSNLDWLAFRYISGELPADELTSFEELLASDDRACLAVTRAVQLTAAVDYCEEFYPAAASIAEAVVTVKKSVDTSSSRSWIAACTVALSLLFVAWVVREVPRAYQARESRSAVAALWIDGADEESAQIGTADNAVIEVEADTDDDEPVPEWLLLAVNGKQTNPDNKTMQD